ncbi:MAG TPA: zinc metalloprotease HtpX [Nitrosopumilaceae archaeon]|nr:zinc metalloprotease HtpX [Nitrosopumilaceae archaeon]
MTYHLIAPMGLTLVLVFGLFFGLLFAIGTYFQIGLFPIIGIGIFMGFIQWYIGPLMLKWTTNMRPLQPGEMPWIEETVAGVCIKNRVKMPKIMIANVGAPNAFVFGRTNNSATLTITQGLLNSLSQEEVEAVISHEVGHIKHNDMVIMTLVSVIPMIAYYVAISTMWGSRSNRDSRGGGAVLIGIGAFVIYFVTNLLILYFSRLRESYADDFGGHQMRPTILASALAKITYGLALKKPEEKNSTLRYFYAVDPALASSEVSRFPSFYKDQRLTEDEINQAMRWEKTNPLSRFGEIFRTHPLTYKRIERLLDLEKELGFTSA